MKEPIKSIVVLAAVCLVVVGLLAGTYAVIRPVIDRNDFKAENAAKLELIPRAAAFTPVDEQFADGIDSVYKAEATASASDPLGYIVTSRAMGFRDDITVMTAVGMDGKIIGVKIVSMNETPGWGDVVGEEPFLSQFSGQSKLENVDTATRATVSAKAVIAAAQLALDAFDQINGVEESQPADVRLALFPHAVKFEQVDIEGAADAYICKDGYIISTDLNLNGGYAGATVMCGFGADGKLVGVKILEDPDAAQPVSCFYDKAFLDELAGKTASEIEALTPPGGESPTYDALKASVSGAFGLLPKLTSAALDKLLAAYQAVMPTDYGYTTVYTTGLGARILKTTDGPDNQGFIVIVPAMVGGYPAEIMTGVQKDGTVSKVVFRSDTATDEALAALGEKEGAAKAVGQKLSGYLADSSAPFPSNALEWGMRFAAGLFKTYTNTQG